MITQESIERVRTGAGILEVVSETVQLKRSGANYVGLCPFHGERSPSFFVRESTNSYTCFGCGVHGNVISFVMQTKALSFPDAVEYLAQRFQIELQYTKSDHKRDESVPPSVMFSINRLAFRYFRSALKQVKAGGGEYKTVRDYLVSRGLTADAINTFGIGYAPSGWKGLTESLLKGGVSEELLLVSGLARRSSRGELIDLFRGRLMFPIFMDAKRVAGFGGRLIPGIGGDDDGAPKYVNSPETPVYQKSKALFGLTQGVQAIRASKTVYLVEGYMDVIGLWQGGVRNSVACCGTAVTEGHVRRLSNIASRLFMLLDGDSAGRNAAGKTFAVTRNAPLDTEVIFLPEGQDPDDLARREGDKTPEAIEQLPRLHPVDAYVDAVLARHGCSADSAPGPNLLGTVSNEVAKSLAQIERAVTRTELARRVARRLGVAESALLEEAENEAPLPVEHRIGATGPAREPEGIRRVDREVLACVMVGRKPFVEELMRHVDACAELQPLTMQFVMALGEITELPVEDGKAQVRRLLETLGPDWLKLWREAHHRAESPEVDIRSNFLQCLESLRRRRAQAGIELAELEARSLSGTEEERARLFEHVRGLRQEFQKSTSGPMLPK